MLTFLLFIISILASSVWAIVGAGGGVIIKPVLDMLGVLPVSTVSFCAGCTVLGWERTEIDGERYDIGEEVREKLKDPGAAGFLLDGMNIDFTRPLKVSPNDDGFDYFFGTAASLDQPPYVYIENRWALAVPDHITGVFPLDRAGATQQELWQRGPAAPGFDFEAVIGDMHEKVLALIEEQAGLMSMPTSCSIWTIWWGRWWRSLRKRESWIIRSSFFQRTVIPESCQL